MWTSYLLSSTVVEVSCFRTLAVTEWTLNSYVYQSRDKCESIRHLKLNRNWVMWQEMTQTQQQIWMIWKDLNLNQWRNFMVKFKKPEWNKTMDQNSRTIWETSTESYCCWRWICKLLNHGSTWDCPDNVMMSWCCSLEVVLNSEGILQSDYFRYVFTERKEDVDVV